MRLHCVPQWEKAKEWAAVAEKYGAAFEYNEFFSPAVLDDPELTDRIVNEYKSLGRDTSCDTLHGAFFDIVIDSSDKRIREVSLHRVRQSLDIARLLGCRAVIFHTNYISGFKRLSYRDRWVKECTGVYTELCGRYPDIDIFVENMFDDSPELLRRLAEQMEGTQNFGVCFDPAHAYLWEVPLEQWIRELSPYLRHMHFNDNYRDEDSHLAVGEGTLPWKVLNDSLIVNVNPSVLIEVSSVERFEKSVEYLKANGIYPFNTHQ